MSYGHRSYGGFSLSEEEIHARRAAEPSIFSPRFKKAMLMTAAMAAGVAGISFAAYKGFVEPYQNDRQWYQQALAETEQIIKYEKEGNSLMAQKLENGLWSDMAFKKREGSAVTQSEMDDIASRLNRNNTRGARIGESLD